MRLIQGDCLEEMDSLIKEGIKVDAIICDPPYGTIKGISDVTHGLSGKTEWDFKINTSDIFNKSELLLREKGVLILFSQEPYTSELTTSQHNNLPFSYRNIWLKDHFANALTAKKAPLNYYEDINVFYRKYDLYNENPLRAYFKDILRYVGLSSCKQVNDLLGHRKAEHCFYISSTQFKLCTKQVYSELEKIFNLPSASFFKTYDELSLINKRYTQTFNLPIGKKHKSNVFKYKKDYEGFHPTQKPVKLMEDLIMTYTNENETVLDFTMGSGSTGVACKNLNRDFIGIEKEEKYFKIAEERIRPAIRGVKRRCNE